MTDMYIYAENESLIQSFVLMAHNNTISSSDSILENICNGYVLVITSIFHFTDDKTACICIIVVYYETYSAQINVLECLYKAP